MKNLNLRLKGHPMLNRIKLSSKRVFECVGLKALVRFGKPVTHRSRQGAHLAKRANFGISGIRRSLRNPARRDALTDECHRIDESGHLGRFWGVLALACVLWSASCGIKAPPVPPHQITPPAVSDLQYRMADGTLILSWSIPAPAWERQPDVSSFVVYRSIVARKDAGCKNCPLLFTRVAQVPVVVPEQGRSAAMRMRYREKLLKGYRYVYKVVSRTATNVSSADSNLVTFDY